MNMLSKSLMKTTVPVLVLKSTANEKGDSENHLCSPLFQFRPCISDTNIP